METMIVNATLITGDGRTILPEACVIIQDDTIEDIVPLRYITYSTVDRVIDAEGGYVIPGIVNHHAHGLTPSPLFPYGSPTLSWRRAEQNLDSHLRKGTTTILSIDGLVTPWEVEVANKRHPMRVRTGTAHTPKNIELALMVDGRGLQQKHRRLSVETMIKNGAVAIAEIGAPGTTNGTLEMSRSLGRNLSTPQAGAIVELYWPDRKPTIDEISKVIEEWGLGEITQPEQVEQLYRECYLRPIELANESIIESTEYSKQFSTPVIIHNSPQTEQSVLTAARKLGPMMVAGHSNFMFGVEQAVEHAKKVKEAGAYVDVITGDGLGAKQLFRDADVAIALLREGLVDLISTDFIGGFADPIVDFVDHVVDQGAVDLAEAIAMCTSNVARAIPGLARDRGLLEPGKIADICITERDEISEIQHVLIGGDVVWSSQQ